MPQILFNLKLHIQKIICKIRSIKVNQRIKLEINSKMCVCVRERERERERERGTSNSGEHK